MRKIYKRYSLADKRKYWGNKLDYLSQKKNKTKEESAQMRYAQGFYISSKNGKLTKDFNDLDLSNQIGQLNGFKAKKYNKK